MTTLDRHATHRPDPTSAGSARARLAPLTGAAFVVAALAGNSLTESVTGADTLDRLGEQAASTAFRAGLALELCGLAALAVFVAWVAATLRRRGPLDLAGTTALVAGVAMVTLKLSSGSVLLAAVHEHDEIDEATAVGLVAANGEAFVLFWVVFGLFVAAVAIALHAAGLAGAGTRATGVVLGVLTLGLGVVGAVVPAAAVPIPFLLSLVWLVVLSVRSAHGNGS